MEVPEQSCKPRAGESCQFDLSLGKKMTLQANVESPRGLLKSKEHHVMGLGRCHRYGAGEVWNGRGFYPG